MQIQKYFEILGTKSAKFKCDFGIKIEAVKSGRIKRKNSKTRNESFTNNV